MLAEIAERRRADIAAELDWADLRRTAPGGRSALQLPETRSVRSCSRACTSSPRSSAARHPLGTWPRPAATWSPARVPTRQGGASIISVLVEPHWFGGSLADLTAVRASVRVPVLAKEFVVDRRQLPILRAAGADLVLLIAALHGTAALRSLVRAAQDLGMEPLVEAHDRRELDRALATEARLIGLNNRDLRTLAVDPERAVRLRADVPDDRLVVAESGVREPATVAGWRAVGLDAALIGEALMTMGDDADAIRARTAAFVAAGRPPSATEDPAAADREPLVKICGVTDVAGALAAVRAGADAIGLNFVPGTPRALDERTAAGIIGAIRSAASPAPLIVGVMVDRDPDDANAPRASPRPRRAPAPRRGATRGHPPIRAAGLEGAPPAARVRR